MKTFADHKITAPKSLLVIGPPGVGKSTFVTAIKGAMIVDFDQNLQGPMRFNLKHNRMNALGFADPYHDKNDKPLDRTKWWDRLVEIITEACNHPEVEYIVLDSLTQLTDIVYIETRKAQKRKLGNGKGQPDEQLQIQDWAVFQQIVKQLILWIKSSSKKLIVCAHIDLREDELTKVLLKFLMIPSSLKGSLSGLFEEAWELEKVTEGAGQAAKTVLTLKSVPDSKSLNLGLKSSLGLPAKVTDPDEILKLLQPE